jgi:hypothetical protein
VCATQPDNADNYIVRFKFVGKDGAVRTLGDFRPNRSGGTKSKTNPADTNIRLFIRKTNMFQRMIAHGNPDMEKFVQALMSKGASKKTRPKIMFNGFFKWNMTTGDWEWQPKGDRNPKMFVESNSIYRLAAFGMTYHTVFTGAAMVQCDQRICLMLSCCD